LQFMVQYSELKVEAREGQWVVGGIFSEPLPAELVDATKCNGQAGQARLRVAVKDKDGNWARNKEPGTGGRTARTVI
jgi:hypothetical protein